MNTYKLIVAYDGTAYTGWQQQPNVPTVIKTLKYTFYRVFKTEAAFLGASRTDAGVHALGQVVRCITSLFVDPSTLKWALNNSLPSDMHIRKVQRVAGTFHPQHNIVHKIYYYHFFIKKPVPFIARYGWYCRQTPDIQKLREILSFFVGTHDFRSFCCAEDTRENTTRTIDTIDLRYIKRIGIYQIRFTGHSFLRHMIRRIVGTSIQISSNKKIPVDYIKDICAAKDPGQTVFNAPSQGLLLYTIIYSDKKEYNYV